VVAGGVFAFLVSFLACAAIYRARRTLGIALDPPFGAGPQKFHTGSVPRIGGIPMFAAIVSSVSLFGSPSRYWLLALVCAAAPAFLGGLVEDLTKRMSAASRLFTSFAAAGLGFLLLDARVTDLDIPGSELLLQIALFSFFVTLFAVAGFSHALNIVDGFNGLSGMVALLMLTVLGIVAAQVGDSQILMACIFIGGAVLGFLLWNYPKGLIFAGDGGAYLLGFLIAELAVLLAHRNPEVSAWFPLVLLLYPVVETCFSIYRKKILRGQSPAEPDGVHLHMLIHKRLVRRFSGGSDKWKANSLTTPYLVAITALSVLPSLWLWHSTSLLQLVAVGFTALYLWFYWRIVRFRAPRILVLRSVWRPALTESHHAPAQKAVCGERQAWDMRHMTVALLLIVVGAALAHLHVATQSYIPVISVATPDGLIYTASFDPRAERRACADANKRFLEPVKVQCPGCEVVFARCERQLHNLELALRSEEPLR
jgi:UDP-GlcNAc:undecaprenyl-phosphate GlcNAc-1-phosphate transferase